MLYKKIVEKVKDAVNTVAETKVPLTTGIMVTLIIALAVRQKNTTIIFVKATGI